MKNKFFEIIQNHKQDQHWFVLPHGKDKYKISCDTQNGGTRYLEAFPSESTVRPREPEDSVDQIWSIEAKGNGQYSIFCDTKHSGRRFLEAHNLNEKVRLNEASYDADQLWSFDKV